MDRIAYHSTPSRMHLRFALLLTLLALAPCLRAQDIFGEANKAPADRTRLAVADFKPSAGQADALRRTFNATLFNDLQNAGIFDMVSKSIAPPVTPGSPAEMKLDQWSPAPVSAAMVAF